VLTVAKLFLIILYPSDSPDGNDGGALRNLNCFYADHLLFVASNFNRRCFFFLFLLPDYFVCAVLLPGIMIMACGPCFTGEVIEEG